MKKYAKLSAESFKKKDMIKQEIDIVTKLKFRVEYLTTPYRFMLRYGYIVDSTKREIELTEEILIL